MSLVHCNVEAAVARVWIDNPPLNLLTQEIRRVLGTLFERLSDDESVRAIVLGGAPVFCAGADMKEFPERFSRETARDHVRNGHRMTRAVVGCRQPTIAAVEGACLGGGYELALCCDEIVATRDAKVGLPEIRRGIFPGTGGLPLLARRIGAPATKRLAIGGEIHDGEAALRLGLLDRSVTPGDALAAATAQAVEWANGAPAAVQAIKALSDHDDLRRLDAQLQREARAFEDIFQTADAREGAAAFFEKREARWAWQTESITT